MASRIWFVALVATLAVAPSGNGIGKEASIAWERLRIDGKTDLEFALALPAGARKGSPGKAAAKHPLVVVLPGGPGQKPQVESAMAYFADAGVSCGWIVVSPEAPNGELFFKGGERVLEPLVRHLREAYAVEEGQVHLAGISNGGTGAFHALLQAPELWASVLVLPGAIQSVEEMEKLGTLGKPITLYAGERDPQGFQMYSRQIALVLDRKKAPYTFRVRKGEGHIMPIPGSVLMEDLERHRKSVKDAGKAK